MKTSFRRRFTTLAAATALVAGLTAVLAPAASAAGEATLTITNLPPAIPNNGVPAGGTLTALNVSGINLATPGALGTTGGVDNVAGIQVKIKGAGLVAARANGDFSTLKIATNPVIAATGADFLTGTVDTAGTDTLIKGVHTLGTGWDLSQLAPAQALAPTPFTVTVDTSSPGAWSGNLTITISLVSMQAPGAPNPDEIVDTLGSASVTVPVSNPAVPIVIAPPRATVYQPYSHQLTNLGVPAVTQAQIAVYRDSGSGPVILPNAATYTLNNGLVFDTATGRITRSLTSTDTTNPNPDRYTVVLNNGVGGSGTAQPATSTTPALVPHDVMIQFRIPVMFSDVSTAHQFYGEIYRMAAAGITKGNANGTFKPAADVSRQAFAAFAVTYLNRAHTDLGVTFGAFGLSTPLKTGSCTAHSTTSAFVDVADSSQFCMEIKELAALGITKGYNEFSFQPTRNISRQALSAMMWRTHLVAQGYTDPVQIADPVTCTGASAFADVKVSNQFCGEIAWMAAESISTGYAGNKYRPTSGSTRQATIAFIDRMGVVDGLTGFGA